MFEVILFPIHNAVEARNEAMYAAADEVVPLPLHFHGQAAKISANAPDVLVYADLLSEVSTHQLSLARLAPVQVAFWGNPDTVGHLHTIDYFVSADQMETRDSVDAYSEQVVRLGGQGIM